MVTPSLNITNASSVIDLPTLFEYFNDMSNGYFIALGLLLAWLVTFIILKSTETRAAATATSFIIEIIAGLGFFAGFVSQAHLWMCSIILFACLIWDVWKGGDEG